MLPEGAAWVISGLTAHTDVTPADPARWECRWGASLEQGMLTVGFPAEVH